MTPKNGRTRGLNKQLPFALLVPVLLISGTFNGFAEEPVKPPEKAALPNKSDTDKDKNDKAEKPDQTAAAATKGDTTPTAAADETVGDQDISIMVGGVPTPGRAITPATETEFRFKLAENGVEVSMRWSDLQEMERKRVQKLYGIVVRGDRKLVGEKIKGVKILLNSGKSLEGFLLPERDRAGQKALKTATALQLIPEHDIKSMETSEYDLSEFYTPREIYERWLLEKPPGQNDAGAHYAMAQKTANIGLYDKALDHLQMAAVIDPRTEERYKDFRLQLISENAKQQAWDRYSKMVQAKNSGDPFTAWFILEELDRNFPNSEYKSRWDALRPELEAATKTELNKRVVQMCYPIAADLLLKEFTKKIKVDEKGNMIPSIPGKLVTTRQGRVFRGKLVDSQPEGDMVLRSGDLTLTITGKDIMSVQDVDLSVAIKEANVSFDEMKDFITDTNRPDGLKAKMLTRISQLLKVPEAKVKEIFDNRLERQAKYDHGELTMSPCYATLHDVSWGKGSWLREGSVVGPIIQDNNNNNNQPRANRFNNNGNNPNQPAAPKEDPDLTDDQVVWWKYQDQSTQFDVLRGMVAEKIFEIKEPVQRLACPQCHGQTTIPAVSAGGVTSVQRCPTCRGMGILFRVHYH